ncbi:MAG: DUF7544 domain-containing protein [Chthoniobacterales bacterium]
MNGDERRIEIFAPFNAAYDLTRRILFEPFDFAKWLTIAFAAFLAGLADGTHTGGGFNPGGGNWNFRDRAATHDLSAIHQQIASCLTPIVIAGLVLFFLALVTLCMWLGSRGRFMFIDCIVRNRGAIVEPWHEFRREGNGLFLFKLIAFMAAICLWGVIALPWLIPYLSYGTFPPFDAARIVFLIFAILLFVPLSILWAVLVWFMVPVMYRQRHGPVAACSQVLNLLASYPGPFILYVLFVFVLVVGGLLVSCVLTCLTCCLAAVPYIGTVILLPLYVFYYSYTLLFLRQFGPDYDAWGNIAAVTEAAPPPLPPRT